MIGHGHLGVITLPTTEDDYEQPSINNFPGLKKRPNSVAGCDHSEINLLIFGGSKFREREPNNDYLNDMCCKLSIRPKADTYSLTYLPGARLKCPDTFFSNMNVRCDINKNTVTVIGNNAVHRINTGKKNPSHLHWKKAKKELGYGKVLQDNGWHDVMAEQ